MVSKVAMTKPKFIWNKNNHVIAEILLDEMNL